MAIQQSFIDNIILNKKKNEIISSKLKNEKRMPILPTFIQYSTAIPSQSNKAKEEIKGIQIGKEKLKLSLFANDMILFADDLILYIKDPKNSTKIFLHIINTFSKVAGYKINIQKSVAFLYINNEQTKKEITK
jgi:hypothetical protein